MEIKIENNNLVIPISTLNSVLENSEIPLRIVDEQKMLKWLRRLYLEAYEKGEAWIEGII